MRLFEALPAGNPKIWLPYWNDDNIMATYHDFAMSLNIYYMWCYQKEHWIIFHNCFDCISKASWFTNNVCLNINKTRLTEEYNVDLCMMWTIITPSTWPSITLSWSHLTIYLSTIGDDIRVKGQGRTSTYLFPLSSVVDM